VPRLLDAARDDGGEADQPVAEGILSELQAILE